MKFKLNKGKWSKMTLRYKVCLFPVKHVEDHDINVDRAELLSLNIGCLPLFKKTLFTLSTVIPNPVQQPSDKRQDL